MIADLPTLVLKSNKMYKSRTERVPYPVRIMNFEISVLVLVHLYAVGKPCFKSNLVGFVLCYRATEKQNY